MTIGDFNFDGKADLAAANSGSTTVSVLIGNGAGTFQAARNFAAGSGPMAAALGDFNGDGRPDLAVPSYYSTPSPCCWAAAAAFPPPPRR